MKDSIEVSPPDARKACVPIILNRLNVQNRDGVGPHKRIEALSETMLGQELRNVDMRGHRQGVDAGVGPARGMNGRDLARHPMNRFLDGLLH